MAKGFREIYGTLGKYELINGSVSSEEVSTLEDSLNHRMTARDMMDIFYSIFPKSDWTLDYVTFDKGYLVFKFRDEYRGDWVSIWYSDAKVDIYVK